MIKLCIFSLPFHPNIGGLESISMLVASWAAQCGNEVEIVTASKSANPSDDAQYPFKITRTHSVLARFRAFRRSDVILFMNVSLMGLPLALLANRPIVLSHHGIYHAPNLRNICLGFVKRAITRFFLNISVSEYVARHIHGPSVIVPNAYDADQFTCAVDSCLRPKDFVFCGRLASDKGADVLLRAFAHVVKAFPEAALTIIGDGLEREKLESFTKEKGIQQNVEFTGPLRGQKLADTLKKHACMVIPSLWDEPFGIVALEGIACCQTIISSCRGGLPEAVGSCGILVEPTAENLTDAMRVVMSARRNGDSLPGQPTAEIRDIHLFNHSPETICQKYIDVCSQIVRKG